jgi:hypothetical protein
MKVILDKKPRSINSIDSKDKNWTALHYACHQKNWEMLNFLSSQPYIDFNVGDFQNEIPLYEAIKNEDVAMVEFLVNKCGSNIEHREI